MEITDTSKITKYKKRAEIAKARIIELEAINFKLKNKYEKDKEQLSRELKKMLDLNNSILKIINYVEYEYNSKWIKVEIIKIYIQDNSIDIKMPNGNIRNTIFSKIRKFINTK